MMPAPSIEDEVAEKPLSADQAAEWLRSHEHGRASTCRCPADGTEIGEVVRGRGWRLFRAAGGGFTLLTLPPRP